VLALAIVVATLLLNAAVFALVLRWLRSRRTAARADLRRLLGYERPLLEADARLVGVRSLGWGQLRGTGSMALSSRELVFVMWVPRRELRIQRHAITGAETGHGLAGKWTSGRLLHVRWRVGDTTDEAAWAVPEMEAWLAALGAG
jgi:hypothetical protein